MTAKERKEIINAVYFKGVMRSALNELKQYAREYNSGICEGIAHRMEKAFEEYKF